MSNSNLELNLRAEAAGEVLQLTLGESALDRMNAKDFRDRAAGLVTHG